jgi:hypothetical protein
MCRNKINKLHRKQIVIERNQKIFRNYLNKSQLILYWKFILRSAREIN